MADTDTYTVTPKTQKVFHDGMSMIVLKPGEKAEVEGRFVAGLIADGVIDKPKGFTSLSSETTTVADGFQSNPAEGGVEVVAADTKDVPPA